MRRYWWLPAVLVAIGLVLGIQHFSGANEPSDHPRPIDFVTVEILSPRHGEVLRSGQTTVHVKLWQPGGIAGGYQLHLALDGNRLDRQGRVSSEPIRIPPGETEVVVPLRLPGTGVYTLEAYSMYHVPFSNRVQIQFGVNPYLREQ